MTTYHYSIEFSYKTYTGTVQAVCIFRAREAAQSDVMPRIMKDYGQQTKAEFDADFKKWGKVNASQNPIEAPRPVLHNMLTGEKVVGEPGMSECQLFGMMAAGR